LTEYTDKHKVDRLRVADVMLLCSLSALHCRRPFTIELTVNTQQQQ